MLGQYVHNMDQGGEGVTFCTAPQNVPSATRWLRRCIGGGYIEERGSVNTRSVNTITYLTNISFGLGAAESLAETLRELGVSNPLVISDHGVRAAGLLQRRAFEFL